MVELRGRSRTREERNTWKIYVGISLTWWMLPSRFSRCSDTAFASYQDALSLQLNHNMTVLLFPGDSGRAVGRALLRVLDLTGNFERSTRCWNELPTIRGLFGCRVRELLYCAADAVHEL